MTEEKLSIQVKELLEKLDYVEECTNITVYGFASTKHIETEVYIKKETKQNIRPDIEMYLNECFPGKKFRIIIYRR